MIAGFFTRLRRLLSQWWHDFGYLFRGTTEPALPKPAPVYGPAPGASSGQGPPVTVNERLEYMAELRYSIAPGCDETKTTSHEFKWVLTQVHGAVLAGAADRQALADVRLQIHMGRSTSPIVDLPLNLITEGEHTLERRIQSLEAELRRLHQAIDKHGQQSEDPAVQAMARLGWTRGNADYRVLTVPGYAEEHGEVRCRVTASEEADFEPFEWQLTLRGVDTRPVS